MNDVLYVLKLKESFDIVQFPRLGLVTNQWSSCKCQSLALYIFDQFLVGNLAVMFSWVPISFD
jgi:hypothetical protein